MLYKKSVVLDAIDNTLKKAVVNLETTSAGVVGDVRLYNFSLEPMGILTLAMLANGKVHKSGLTRVGFMHYHFKSTLSQIPASCSLAVVSSKGGEAEPLLLGAMDGQQNFENTLLENLSVLEQKSYGPVKEIIDKNLGQFENQAEIEEQIDAELGVCSKNCLGCHYKTAFYEDIPVLEPKTLNNEIVKGKLRVPEQKDSHSFFDQISPQLDPLFEKFPHDEVLEGIIPNSKWVRVEPGNGKFYVVGLIYEEENIKYVCYGTPAMWSSQPPADFSQEAKWLAVDLDKPQGEGYWITYQDAFDGELVAVNVI